MSQDTGPAPGLGRPWPAAMDRKGVGTPRDLAGFWRRFVAFFVDSTLVGIITDLVSSGLHGPSQGAVGLILSGLYWTLFIGGGGQTLGMRLLKIRVIPSDGRAHITYLDGALRYVVMVVGEMALFLGFVWAGWDRNRQAWHDLAARTLVVRT